MLKEKGGGGERPQRAWGEINIHHLWPWRMKYEEVGNEMADKVEEAIRSRQPIASWRV
jgi:hypothetical protein